MKDSKAANVQFFRAGPDVDEVVGGGVSHVGKGLRTGITKIRIGEESMDFKLKNFDHPFFNLPSTFSLIFKFRFVLNNF